jgi:GTP-binding protein
VERTRLLVHLVEPDPMDQSDPLDNYAQIREELRLYDQSLAERPEIICVTKAELPDAATCAELLREVTGKDVFLISAVTGKGLPELNRLIIQRLAGLKSANESVQVQNAQPQVDAAVSSDISESTETVQ